MKKMIVGVLGSGSMGAGIAQVAASRGHRVILVDQNESALQKAYTSIQDSLEKLTEKGKISPDEQRQTLASIQTSVSIKDFESCSLIIEAIVENLEIKKNVFKDLEQCVQKDCILATNTSSLSIASIASSCNHPERVIGIHFFNPATIMKLVEVIPAVQTSSEIIQKSKDIIDSWGKTTVLTKDTPGFIVNRVARPFYGEALRILEEGMADIATIDWAMTSQGGFKMGPFTLMDYIGNDINYTVTESVFHSFYYDPKYKPSFTQKRLHEAKFWGRKTGRGHYIYDGSPLPTPTQDDNLGHIIFERILAMLINEAADALFWNIATVEDIDLAMTQGVNYPKGLLKWADEKGPAYWLEKMDRLYSFYREDRYRCSPLLRKLAQEDQLFYNQD